MKEPRKIVKFARSNYVALLFFAIFLVALLLRVYGLNWDEGYHLHPDERMILIVADRIKFFTNLDPDFFAYGSFPIYLLRLVSEFLNFIVKDEITNYSGMLLVGRYLSTMFELGTVVLVFELSLKFFKDKLKALFSMFFYSIAFFPIQNSNFFITDTILTFLMFLLLSILVKYLYTKKGSVSNTILQIIKIGVIFGVIMATKITGIIFLPVVGLVLLIKSSNWQTKVVDWKNLLIRISVFILVSIFTSFICMPYAFLNWQKFFADISSQFRMNSDPYVFPYTLQYVGTTAYLYYLRNIFLWGLGPFLSILAIIGIYKLLLKFVNEIKQKKIRHTSTRTILLLFSFFFYLFYFIVIGRSAVKFMRYMLPVYPFLAILVCYGFFHLVEIKKQKNRNVQKIAHLVFNNIKFGFAILVVFFACLWSLAFVNIYALEHTRIQATQWILSNIAQGSNIGVEHWDDRLPLDQSEKYNIVELTLYDRPDDEFKWQQMDEKLKSIDYLVIASNRLYVPLQKLAECNKYKECYPKTSKYYQDLFNNQKDFQLMQTFSVTPYLRVPFTDILIEIDDQGADESFTVYDHPKIYIFKNNRLSGN